MINIYKKPLLDYFDAKMKKFDDRYHDKYRFFTCMSNKPGIFEDHDVLYLVEYNKIMDNEIWQNFSSIDIRCYIFKHYIYSKDCYYLYNESDIDQLFTEAEIAIKI